MCVDEYEYACIGRDVTSFTKLLLFSVGFAVVLSTLRQTYLSPSRICSIYLHFGLISVNQLNDHNKRL